MAPPLRIAMVGLRGVPAAYSGIERHVEEVGWRLAERGHEITVFCRGRRADHGDTTYRGMQLVHFPAVRTKHLETITHTTLATARSMAGFDVVHFHALGPGLLAPFPRYLSRAAVIQTVHGLDGERAKWGTVARRALRAAEHLSARLPDATITVSRTLADHYRARWGRDTVCIPNGVNEPGPATTHGLAELGLVPRKYIVFVGRLVPEKAPDLLVRAFRRLPHDCRLAIVGGSAHTDDYVERLQALAAGDPRVVLTGPVYDDVLANVYANALAFVSPSTLEAGPPLTMLEAASHGTAVVGSDIAAQLEALVADAPGRRVFRTGDEDALAAALERVLADPDAERTGAARLREEVLAGHRWDDAALALEQVYVDVTRDR